MWTPTTRQQHSRAVTRYQTDLTDAEWLVIAPWIGRNRRLAKDFEATIDSARAFLYAASVMLLARRIGRAP
jgi:transposase